MIGVSEFPLHETGVNRYVTSSLLDAERGVTCRFLARGGTEEGFPAPVLSLRQVHGDRVFVLDERSLEGARREPPEADAVITGLRGAPVAIRTADCASVVVHDRRTPALGAIHAGWRGTVRSIVWKTLLLMMEEFGTNPDDCRAAIGPAIAGKCYEVGEDVREAFDRGLPYGGDLLRPASAGKWWLDLLEGNRRQLLDGRLGASRVQVCPYCTHCEAEWFHSARRDGPGAGRQSMVAMLL